VIFSGRFPSALQRRVAVVQRQMENVVSIGLLGIIGAASARLI
jgi:hypothetical protein